MFNPPPAGEIITSLIEDSNLSIKEATEFLGITEEELSHLIITPEIALRLSKLFGTSDKMWLNVQAQYDLFHKKSESI